MVQTRFFSIDSNHFLKWDFIEANNILFESNLSMDTIVRLLFSKKSSSISQKYGLIFRESVVSEYFNLSRRLSRV